MDFTIGTADSLALTDDEISELLWSVYVDGGYTNNERAKTIFNPASIRQRGEIICIRSKADHVPAGMIILVFSTSPAKKFASGTEAEIHLLAVKHSFRNKGIGKSLVNEVLARAKSKGVGKILLWTQSTMPAAQRLYERAGFIHLEQKDFTEGGRNFLFYEKTL